MKLEEYHLRALACDEKARHTKTRFSQLWRKVGDEFRYLEEFERSWRGDETVGNEPHRSSGPGPSPEPITRADLDDAEQAVAQSERRIDAQAQLIEERRANGLATDQAEAFGHEMQRALWHQRGLAFELRKFLKKSD